MSCECITWCRPGMSLHRLVREHHHPDCKRWHREIGEAIVTKTEFMVLGQPDPDDESHNCDAMGCSSVSHVLVRMSLASAFPPPSPPVTAATQGSQP